MPAGLRLFAAILVPLALSANSCRTGDPLSAGTPPSPSAERPVLAPTYRASGHMAAGDAFVHLFEWRWPDIASECESVLGPRGFTAVQVSPPQEHIILGAFPWWERYQAVSYNIDRSRSGTRVEFIDMVGRCRAVGVGIYVDAVVNHMTAGSGTGSNGTTYTKYSYPSLYTQDDFHTPCSVNNYQSAANVQDCELFGLADLNTGSAAVQQKIADYLIGLARLGVAGFRLDAAKHIQQVELDHILGRVNQTLAAEGRPLPYYFAEVIDYGGEAIAARDYYGLAYGSGGAADITEFKFRGVGDKFLGMGGQRLSQLDPNGPTGSQFSAVAWGLMPPDKAVVFLENHDTQRQGGIGYRDGDVYRLANVWMLAQPYGYPSIMSSYAFDPTTQAGRDRGPPSDATGATNSVTCASSLETATIGLWVCEHRDPFIVRMIAFRRAAAGADVNHWWSDGANAIAFSRGSVGFVAINREPAPVTAAIATGLPAGVYCDVLTGGRNGASCVGTSVSVGATGTVQITLGSNRAIVIYAATRL
ncbi:MAG: carbohydrate-binding module family 20 domain-containing protein [Gemmatimonadaceae bacterium]